MGPSDPGGSSALAGATTAANTNWVAITAAAAVTTIDGFDSFSLSLAAPHIATDLGLGTPALGVLFAGTMGGMIGGAVIGGVVADRLGRLTVLVVSLCVFGFAALAFPFASAFNVLIANRAIAGFGLGAAAPVAIALLNRSSPLPPTELSVAVVWSGIGLGGLLAALFNATILPHFGWRSIFIIGGLLPFAAAAFAYLVFRGHDERAVPAQTNATAAGALQSLSSGAGWRLAGAVGIFFFGYMTNALIMSWLPTILVHRHASNAFVSGTFAAANIGGVFGTVALGALAARTGARHLLPAAWFGAGAGLIAAALCGGATGVGTFAVAAVAITSGAQGLSVARVNHMQRAIGVETALLGLCLGAGRAGQFGILGLSGLTLKFGMRESGLFVVAAVCAALAGIFSALLSRESGLGNSP